MVMIVVVTVVFWFCTKDLPAPAQFKTFGQSMSVLKYKSTWLLSVFYFLTFGGFVAFSVYLPTFLKELFKLSVTEAGLRTAIFVLVATLIRPLGGYLADKYLLTTKTPRLNIRTPNIARHEAKMF